MSGVNRQVEILRLREELAQVKAGRAALEVSLAEWKAEANALAEKFRWRKWPEEKPPEWYEDPVYIIRLANDTYRLDFWRDEKGINGVEAAGWGHYAAEQVTHWRPTDDPEE